MGKVRIKTIGITEEEEKEKKKEKARKEAKKGKKTAKVPGLKGGERVVMMEPSEKELAAASTSLPEEIAPEKSEEVPAKDEKKVKIKRPPRIRGKKYQGATKLVEKSRLYPLKEALVLAKKTGFSHFDGSIEVHINTLEKGLAGSANLPHGTGKQVRVAIADDKSLGEIEKGKIDFDILLARPEFMPRLAKVAKFLGPRGLMPSPKNGTVSDEPEKIAKKLKQGEMRFKTEAQAPIIHLIIGKASFPEKNLTENIKSAVAAIGLHKIEKITLASTMGPGIKVDLSSI